MEHKIGMSTACMMALFALIVDGIEIFLDFILIGILLDPAVDFCAAMIFAMWFSHHDVNIVQKSPLSFLGTVVAKAIPVIDMVPFWTIFVLKTIAQERVKEAIKDTV